MNTIYDVMILGAGPAGLTAVLAVCVVIQIIFIVIHKSNLLEIGGRSSGPPGTSLTLTVV